MSLIAGNAYAALADERLVEFFKENVGREPSPQEASEFIEKGVAVGEDPYSLRSFIETQGYANRRGANLEAVNVGESMSFWSELGKAAKTVAGFATGGPLGGLAAGAAAYLPRKGQPGGVQTPTVGTLQWDFIDKYGRPTEEEITRLLGRFAEDKPVVQGGGRVGFPIGGQMGGAGIDLPMGGQQGAGGIVYQPGKGWVLRRTYNRTYTVDRRGHITRDGHFELNAPRMNVLNPHALSRAYRRMTGFAHAARRGLQMFGLKVSGHAKLKGGKRRRR